ncbi:MAG: clostripain-related cysteine peptidase [Rhodomicrobium sp.]
MTPQSVITTIYHESHILLGRLFLLIVLSFVLIVPTLAADWTILIYMNAKNNLEADAIANFEDIASIGSNERVNILVEMGRPRNHASQLYGSWSGVHTFLVKENMKPVPESAVLFSEESSKLDMGNPKTLEEFLVWGRKQYPARRYMVVIWNHGQGWRAETQHPGAASPSFLGGYRAVSFDEDTGSFLYNSDVAMVITKVFGGSEDTKLDVLGFDACLMSMVETAYSVKNSVKTMVASTELEPGAGWPYALWLSKLQNNSGIDEISLTQLIVESYRHRYQNGHHTTLSGINLVGFESVANSLSELSLALISKLNSERSNLEKVRSTIRPFGIWSDERLNTSIDLLTFLDKFQTETKDSSLKELSRTAANSIKKHIISNYRSSIVEDEGYGGTGLAIYFPENKNSFNSDPYSTGYIKDNPAKPVAFVREQNWSDFLGYYLR